MNDEIYIPLPRVVKALRSIVIYCAILAFVIGATSFAGWMLNIPTLRDFPGQLSPRTNTSFCLMLLPPALFILLTVKPKDWVKYVVGIFAVPPVVMGLMTLVEHATGVDLRIDEMLARDTTSSVGVMSPNRMGPTAAINFVLLGSSLILQSFHRHATTRSAQALALLVALIALIPLLGYMYGVSDLYAVTRWTIISWSTALAQLSLAIGILILYPHLGYTRLFIVDDPGGMLLRFAFAPIVVFTILVGYIRITGERLGWYDAAMGTALRVLFSISLYCSMLIIIARMLSRYAADSLRQKELLSVTLASIGDGVIVTNSQGEITFLNPEAERLTGWKHEESVGKPLATVFRIINEETREPVENPVTKVLRQGSTITLSNHTILMAKDGSEIPIDDSGAPVQTPDGKILGVVLDFRDFSEKKMAQNALEQSKKRYRDLIERLPDALCISREGKIIYANAAAQQLFGARQEDIIGHSPEALFSPDDPGVIAQRLAFLGDGHAIETFQKRLVRDDGERRHVEITAIPFSDSDGAAIQWILRDVTERVLAAEVLHQAKTAAEQASVAKDHFLAVLSHELRTPLTPALAAISMMMRSSDLNSDLREQAELIHRNIELEARLVDDLLDVTRITQGKIELHRKPVSINQVLRYAIEVCTTDLDKKNIELKVTLADGPAIILGDATRLQQIFWNVLRNAIKFTPTGGHVEIRSLISPSGENVVVEIQDDGVGIDPDSLPRLFNAFEQGTARITRQFGGLGLGLVISRTMAELHGGTIEASSAGRDKGAIFRIRLPLMSGTIHEDQTTHHLPDVARRATISLRILLVEDHPDTARVMKRLLMAEGHRVETANTVASAMILVDNQDFDLLLSDLGLPDGSGHDLMRMLRSRGIQLPGIAISGYGQQSDISRSREVGFAGHLTKPVNPAQLSQAIAEILMAL